jgi:hypothetical protein
MPSYKFQWWNLPSGDQLVVCGDPEFIREVGALDFAPRLDA